MKIQLSSKANLVKDVKTKIQREITRKLLVLLGLFSANDSFQPNSSLVNDLQSYIRIKCPLA